MEFVLQFLADAIRAPQMVGEEENPLRLRLLYRVPDTTRFLHVSLKVVLAADAESGADEIWVSTAYPMGRSLTRLGNKPTLWRVVD